MPLTVAYAAAVFALAVRAATPEAVAQLPDGLPVLLLSGELDPVGGKDAVQVTALAQLFTERGLPVEQHVYPDARHEVFNETNRDEVTADLIAWLGARVVRGVRNRLIGSRSISPHVAPLTCRFPLAARSVRTYDRTCEATASDWYGRPAAAPGLRGAAPSRTRPSGPSSCRRSPCPTARWVRSRPRIARSRGRPPCGRARWRSSPRRARRRPIAPRVSPGR